ncbi:helix-turn-helix transcriptional regulator [Phytoactinopolyspora halotolerans]|uniref:helix-turn-helix transcriptional regulator n=1 Tax=Phytoactinopolyspora halotolerans TaxID=1981512 RepID=UPI001C20C0E8|nr:helix-turn-helix transcriptional regulator [Phytoactinopolyspora halotolerans]
MPRLSSGFPLVARKAEVDRLRAALERARSGTAGAVLISGDAGVGKSRLMAETAEMSRASGAVVLMGRCVDISAAGFPYLPFSEIVDQIRAHDPELLARRPVLSTLVSTGVADPVRVGAPVPASGAGSSGGEDAAARAHMFDQLQLFDAVLGALSDLSEDACVLLQIEDLHWSDPSSRDLLSFLLSRLSSQRLLVVASYRSDDLHRRHPLRRLLAELVRLPSVERLDLQPFGQDDAETFVRTLSEGEVPGDVVVDIARRSEGNAFFAEELLAARSTSDAEIPTVLADVLLTRVEQLSPVAQRVVRVASVSGRWHVRHSTLHAVMDLDAGELEAALREALQHNILVPGVEDAYTFRHALLREAIYADLLPGERVRLHATYAQWLAKQNLTGIAAALAYHSTRANDLPAALAASVQAAGDAKRKGAFGAMLQHLERALELWDVVDDAEGRAGVSEFTLTCKAAHAAVSAGYPERAVAYMRTAIGLADAQNDPIVSADTRRQFATTLLGNGVWTEAEQVISDAWELIKDSPPSVERAWVLAVRARLSVVDAQRRAFAEAAESDARASGAASAEADALISQAFCENRENRPEKSAELLERARTRAEEAGALDVELRARYNLIVGRHEQGKLDTAAAIADDAAHRASTLGLSWSTYGLQIRWMRAMVHYARGDWDSAAEAATLPGEPVSDAIFALLAACGATVQVARGQFEQAALELRRLRSEWTRNEDEQIAVLAGTAGAELACWQGSPEEAVAIVDEAMATIRACSGEEWPMSGIRFAALGLQAQADRVRKVTAAGDDAADATLMETGARFLETAEQTATLGDPRGGELGPEGRAWLVRARAEYARLCGTDDAAGWQAVIDAFGYGEVYQQAIARWRLAEVHIAADRRDDAAAELQQALSDAKRLGARPLEDAVRSLARRARIPLPGTPVTSADVLTPRERSVLALAAQGHTNRKIGEELFISEKTVSVHLSRVMSKLGAASRTEAVALAYQRGLLDEQS